MSRIGKMPVEVPKGVDVTLKDRTFSVKGPKGNLSLEVHSEIEVKVDGGTIRVARPSDQPRHKALHGLVRSLVANMVKGVNGGFSKTLEIQGVGYRAEVKGKVYIGKNTVIRSGSYIVGPVMIGDNCDIGPNCYIRPSTSIGNNCHIGAAVELKNSIIMNGCKIPHHNYMGDSIIGENCNLGAGTKIANLRLDKANIKINGKDTGRRKLGAIIGDNVKTGINSSINVGTLIGNNTVIGPDTMVKGVIVPNTKIY